MWPLYSTSFVCFFVMTPETCPASEFQPTWSPTLKSWSFFFSLIAPP